MKLTMTVNGELHEMETPENYSLMDFIRLNLGLTGVKMGCNMGECGACTVIVDGVSVNSCLMLAVEADGKDVTTIEGLSNHDKLHPIQKAFAKFGGAQCGYCTPGFIMTSKTLLDENPTPTEEEIRFGLAGNICRCTGYTKIVEAVMAASSELNSQGAGNE